MTTCSRTRARCLLALTAAAWMSAGASAQTPTPNNNADITHQEIQDTHNAGQVGGIYGYAWGSYTCNLGSESLAWINGGTPALAMNAYRLYDGVLEQIGLGFCKHGCCVANGSGCGTCVSGAAGLRPGCRDIYGAGFNAGQGRLGPRSGIDPYLGTFTPIPTLPAGSTVITRKVQVAQADMSATTYPGAQYFAEGVYVCAEEQPLKQLNNATYRRMSVANSGASPTYAWTVAAGSASQMGVPAIQAWRDHGRGPNMPDDSVIVVFADVPSEGRFYAAGKVRDLSGSGAGPWRYDYAVFNLNSARAGKALNVPIAPSATVTDVGFKDVAYHSGEVYDGSDWVGGKVGGSVQWKCPGEFASSPNANALRWGTMYNYRFTANVPPAGTLGSVGLELFKPATGQPDSIQITGLPVPTTVVNTCVADFNDDSLVGTQDIYDYLTAYHSGDLPADLDGVTGISVQDLFDFLGEYFTGCP